jgi:hypothetical protein
MMKLGMSDAQDHDAVPHPSKTNPEFTGRVALITADLETFGRLDHAYNNGGTFQSWGLRGCRRPMPTSTHGQPGQRFERFASRDLTWNGKTAPSSFLHRPLDITRGSSEVGLFTHSNVPKENAMPVKLSAEVIRLIDGRNFARLADAAR